MLTPALRYLRRSPGFVVFSAGILGLAIAAVVSIFSVVNALILAPLPYADGDRIVRVLNKLPKLGLRNNVSGPNFEDWREQSTAFAAMARYNGGEVALTVNGQGVFGEVYDVSDAFFDVFGVKPLQGRLMDRSSVVIADSFRRKHFNSGPAIGQPLKISEKIYTISGIMPANFRFPAQGDVWMLGQVDARSQNRTANNFRAIARVKADRTFEQAQSEMDVIASRLAAKYPESNRERGVGIVRLQDQLAAPYKDTLALLLGAAALLLAIACANIASLTLAKAQGRQREFAIRASIGASGNRIIGQVVLESLLIGLLGAGAGLLMATWLNQGLTSALPAGFPRLDEIGIDWRVISFTAGLGTFASLLFGLYPAWSVSRIDLTASLKDAGNKGIVGGGGGYFRRGLAIGQVALSLLTLCGALLLVRSMSKLLGVDMGMDTKNVLVSYVHIPASTLESHRDAAHVFADLLRDLNARPEVQSASAIMGMPTGTYGSNGAYTVAGKPEPKDLNALPQAGFRVNAPGFFDTMRIPLHRGRDFSEADAFDKPFVAIINESLARQSFPNQDPIGQRIVCGLDGPTPMTIVGVVADVRHNGLAQDHAAELYMPYSQHPYYANELQVAVRTKGDPQPFAETVRQITRQRSPDIAINSITLQSMIEGSVAAPRFRSLLLTVMAGLALTLACAGLYGVLSYLVSRRLTEFGLRRALGAAGSDIARLVWREAALIVVTGLAIGLVLVYALGNALRGFLFGVQPTDFFSIALAIGALTIAALFAAAIPSIGATRADPMTVLRSE